MLSFDVSRGVWSGLRLPRLIEWLPSRQGLTPASHTPGMMAHACNYSSAQEERAGRSEVRVRPARRFSW